MEYIKRFESFDLGKNDIDNICKKYSITNYTINDDMSIDVDGDVDLFNRKLKKLPLKFNHVKGDFNCSYNELTSLFGSPNKVGDFRCGYNKLETLEFAPIDVFSFDCHYNQLTTLEGSPTNINGHFNCNGNKLTTLEYSPNKVGGDFWCRGNKLTTFDFLPIIGGEFECHSNTIYHIYKIFNNKSKIELFNSYDIIQDNGQSVVLDRLNAFLDEIGKPPVNKVHGYNII